MKLFTLAVGLVSVGELLSCFLLASFTTSSYTASLSKRVDLSVHRNGFAKSKLSIEEMLKREHDRIAFIKAKVYVGEPGNEQMQSSTQTPLYSGQIIGTFNYIMKVGLGTPAKILLMVIDTGSDLAWTQCLPCDACYEQQDPIFDPAASSSYQQVTCASAQCTQLSSASSGSCFNTNATKCEYLMSYLDGSYTAGDFALETLTVGGVPVSAAYPFGCGHQNQGLFKGMDGIVGLSRGALSFPAQTKAAFGEIFAYCMPNTFSSTSAGYIEFGTGGAGGVSTPLVTLSKTTAYVVELEYVQVEGTSSKSKPPQTMAMVVDSGTVITRLDRPLYEQVRDAFKAATASMKEAPQGAGLGVFDTCYSVSHGELFPSITFTFMGGLAFTPSAQNSVFPVDNGTFCLALLPLDGLSILGNYQQQSRLFTFDIAHSTLSISSHVAC